MLDILEDKRRMVKVRLKKTSLMSTVCDAYLNSEDYRKLSAKSQKEYDYTLRIAMATEILTGKTIGNTQIQHFTLRHATHAYDAWLHRGVSRANKIASIMSILMNWASYREISYINPMKAIKRVPNRQRTVMWTQDQVNTFLDTAFAQWKYRSIGLIVMMAYEWGQRIGDMRLLTWDSLDLDTQRMDLEQSKRGAEVHLPISDPLKHVLVQQKESFGFQPYVAPQMKPSDGAYKPYILDTLSIYINEVKREAGLPLELTAMDLRRTAITEMVEAGVDVTQIKQVSGHKNINSLTPYIKHTFSGASSALAMRQAHKDSQSNDDT